MTAAADPNKDLLAFVSKLQDEDYVEEALSKRGPLERTKKEKQGDSSQGAMKNETSLKEKSSSLKETASLEDFLSVLRTDSKKTPTEVEPTPAPLPRIKKAKLERQVAYEHTKEDVAKWDPLSRQLRDAEHLQFPLHAPYAPNRTIDSLLTTFVPQTDFEREFAAAVARQEASAPDGEMRLSDLEPEKPALSTTEKAKKRARDMYQLQKYKHVANIKSKLYRKHLAKSKAKKLLKAQLAADPMITVHEQEKARDAAELARIRERLTLKTHKAGKWAHELLLSGKKDRAFRASVSQQVREQELLRQKILGTKTQGSEHQEEEQEVSESEAQELAQLQKAVGVLPSPEDSEAKEQVNALGRRTFGNFSAPVPSIPLTKEGASTGGAISLFAEDDPFAQILSNRLKRNQELAQQIFTQVDEEGDDGGDQRGDASDDAGLPADGEFEKQKQQAVEADAPKTEDVTLPGWGQWSGPNSKFGPNRSPRVTVLKHTPGVAKEQRRDGHLPHVILTERKLKRAEAKYTVERVPVPFVDREQYEQTMQQPIGPEWNSDAMFRRQIRPRVRITPGAVIKPPKVPQLNQS
jgi:U3 small nucleolar RNA-associated protein 14